MSNNPAAEDKDLPSALMEVYEAFRISGGDWNSLPVVPPSDIIDQIPALARSLLEDCTPNLTVKQREGHLSARQWAAAWLELPDGFATVEHFRLLREACSISLNTLKQDRRAARR